MKKRWLLLAAVGLLTGCSADQGGVAPSSDAASEVSEEAADSTVESEQHTRLNVCAYLSNYHGKQEGWYGQVLKEQLGIELNVLYVDEENLEKADVIIWPYASDLFYEWAKNDRLYVWDDALLEKTEILNTKLKPVLECDAALTDGVLYGITGGIPYNMDSTFGLDTYAPETNPIFTINAQSAHAEEAIQYIDWLASAEAQMTSWYGPRGIGWDRDADGVYYLTDLGKQLDSYTVFPGYGAMMDGFALVSDRIWSNTAQIYDAPENQNYMLEYDDTGWDETAGQ